MTKLERFEPTEEGDMVPVQLSAISIGAWVRDEDAEAIEQERDALKAKLEYADTRIRRLETCVEDFLELTEVPDANCSCHLGPPCRDCVEYGSIREVRALANALLKERGV